MKKYAIFAAVILAAATTLQPVGAATETTGPIQRGAKIREIIRQRLQNQHRRIEAGVKLGQITSAELMQLKQMEWNIRTMIANDRAAGKITKAEVQQIIQALNRASRQIYMDRHNGKEPSRA